MNFNQEEYNTLDPQGQSATELPLLESRTKVTEIVSAHGVVFALVQSGVCVAFSRGNFFSKMIIMRYML